MTLRKELGATLAQHIEPSFDLVHQLSTLCLDGNLIAGSWAADASSNQSRFEFGAIGSSPAIQVLSEISTTMASGVDHLSALADALNSDSTIGFSFATIARGALEAYGRAWYFLEAPDADALIKRWLSTRINDLIFASKASEDAGEKAKLNTRMSELKKDATALGMTKDEMKLSFTRLAADFYDAVYKGSDGSREYSILSAVAHAERSGISRLTQRVSSNVASGLHSAKLEASDEFIADLAFTTLTLHSAIFEKATISFGISPGDQKAWSATWADVMQVLLTRS